MQRDVVKEAHQAQVGDARLSRRVGEVTRLLKANPGASLPKAMVTDAAIEAAYRLLRNPRVTQETLLAPHLAGTAKVVKNCSEPVVIAHDTTEFSFSGESRDGLGRLNHGRQGFLGHFGLALVPDPGVPRPLGILAFSNIFRAEKPKGKRTVGDPDSESKRWWKVVEECEERLGNCAVRPIHVMDREADSYELINQLLERGLRFIIRARHNRPTTDSDNCAFDMDQHPSGPNALLERSVPVSARHNTGNQARKHPSRAARIAKLRIHAQRIGIVRSQSLTRAVPEALTLNLVVVQEVDCPEGEPPVCWRLWTTEPVETAAQLGAIVDAYKSRWLIEEFFKALKTGCNYERKQLESADTLLTLLGLYIPIACHLLAMRSLARRDEAELPATCLMSECSLEALRAADRGKLPLSPSIGDALAAIARLGGHIKNNGAPGWMVLWRGYQDFLLFETGWKAARGKM